MLPAVFLAALAGNELETKVKQGISICLPSILSISRCVGNGCDEIAQELGCIHLADFGIELSEGELGRAVNRYKEIQPAFGGLHLGDVNVEVADRVGLELLLRLFVTFDVGKPAGTVTAQAAMQ
jgi:hypothetical protein